MLTCAIVPPVPVPYREPLFAALSEREGLRLRVIYQASSQASWDQASGWFPATHAYDAVHLSARHLPRPGRSPVSWPRGLESELSRLDPDVIVVSEFGPATLRALAWCRRRRSALLILTEVTRDVQATLSPLQRAVHRWLARRADGFVAVSGAARERLVAIGAAPQSIAVSLQPVDEQPLLAARRGREAVLPESDVAPAGRSPESRTPETSPPSRGATPLRLLSVARLVPDKGLDTLIDAIAAAELPEPGASLTIAGGGPLESELRERASRSGVQLELAGALPAEELPARYAAADVFVLASSFEPFGVALREAVVAGLPIVCSTAVGAAGDLAIDGVNALLVPPRDTSALARAIGLICRDPAVRATLAAGSVELASRRTLARDVEAFAAAIESAAAAARAR